MKNTPDRYRNAPVTLLKTQKQTCRTEGSPCLSVFLSGFFFFFPRFTERLSPAQRTSAGVCAVRPAGAGPPRAAAAQTAVDLGFCVLA